MLWIKVKIFLFLNICWTFGRIWIRIDVTGLASRRCQSITLPKYNLSETCPRLFFLSSGILFTNYFKIEEAARLLREGGEESPAALSARQMEQYAATYSRATSRQVPCFIKVLVVPVPSGYLTPWPVAFGSFVVIFSLRIRTVPVPIHFEFLFRCQMFRLPFY